MLMVIVMAMHDCHYDGDDDDVDVDVDDGDYAEDANYADAV